MDGSDDAGLAHVRAHRVSAAIGLATALRGLPLLFFGILAGAVADRSNRKSQLIMAQVINAFVILATLVLLHRVQPWQCM